ncbi:hypothetical protein [Herbaspirillum sp. RV1423]|uniref:hypothetical protein n=1 Tax=Herbaspirillum sp. RV1423 TaxID=1443993 RepID=UPI0004B2271F|nr:hypothetical protein [Herbaspirillum sp. RV1423]
MKSLEILRQNTTAVLVSGILFFIAIMARRMLESTMFSHVLLQMPLLILSGVLLANLRPPAFPPRRPALHRLWRKCDAHGLASMLALLFSCAYWMVPNAIERAVINPFDDFAKFLSLTLAGALLPGALRKSHIVVQIFFIGGIVWMMAMAGMMYQNATQRLCNSYLLDDQVRTGIGLVALAVILPMWWCVSNSRAVAPKNGLRQGGILDDNSGIGRAACKE